MCVVHVMLCAGAERFHTRMRSATRGHLNEVCTVMGRFFGVAWPGLRVSPSSFGDMHVLITASCVHSSALMML